MSKKTILVILLLAAFLSGLGYLLTKWQVRGVTKAIEGSETIILDLWIDEIASTRQDLFQVGEYANLIVRNRPHGKLKIVDSQCKQLPVKRYYIKRTGVEVSEQTGLEPILWQCRLKLEDPQALSTANGYLSHGNQLKIANRIALEGKMYYVDGYIVDIQPAGIDK